MRREEIRLAKLQREADAWNERHPVGTFVRYWKGLRAGKPSGIGQVRHAAQPMSDHVSAWIEGCSGSVSVTHIEAGDPDLAAERRDLLAELAAERERRERATEDERALCAAVCRAQAFVGDGGVGRVVADHCAEAIERGPVDGWVLELSDGADGWAPASKHGMRDRYATNAAAWDAARAAFPDTEYLSLMCRVVERGPVTP